MAFADPNDIRARFCRAMSDMYREEVPLYGDLVELVESTNAAAISADPSLKTRLEATDGLDRISEERHGAIRLGTAEELHTMRRLFAVMGMLPVGYYDLSVAGIPVHSTAFRAIDADALKYSPFRVFTSLLRAELIADPELRAEAEAILADRDIFTPTARKLIDKHEAEGGLSEEDAGLFIQEALKTFRWHADARVSARTYQRLHDAHRLVADVVSFRGPHINHLTPRTLDIDEVQAAMPARGITPKAVIEGPPPRQCPVLLRQTSFKALEEEVVFASDDTRGKHTARFGEIEQRGIALTRKGRALYDELLDRARGLTQPKADGSNARDYMRALSEVFLPLPDDYAQLREQGMAFFHYSPTGKPLENKTGATTGDLIASGHIRFDPIVYEDFLPVSAAGIFQSNLGDNAAADRLDRSNQVAFEAALGSAVEDEFTLYQKIEQDSLAETRAALGLA